MYIMKIAECGKHLHMPLDSTDVMICCIWSVLSFVASTLKERDNPTKINKMHA